MDVDLSSESTSAQSIATEGTIDTDEMMMNEFKEIHDKCLNNVEDDGDGEMMENDGQLSM